MSFIYVDEPFGLGNCAASNPLNALPSNSPFIVLKEELSSGNRRISIKKPTDYLTLLLLPLYILLEQNDGALSILAVISGVMIAFFDFLTCETLTILIPLLIVFIMRKQDDRLPRLRSNLLLTLKCGAAWGLSYAGMFLVKWSVASLVTGENIFITALTSAEVRIAGEAEQLSPVEQFFLAPAANISTLFGGTGSVDWAHLRRDL